METARGEKVPGVKGVPFDPPTRQASAAVSPSAEDEDADVARERRRVQEGGAEDALLRVSDLTKVTSPSPPAPSIA